MRNLRIVKIMGVFLIIVFILEIWMVNRLSTYGTKIEQLQEAEVNLKLENQILENQIAQNSSLAQIEERSSLLGFGNTKNLEYIKSPALASSQ